MTFRANMINGFRLADIQLAAFCNNDIPSVYAGVEHARVDEAMAVIVKHIDDIDSEKWDIFAHTIGFDFRCSIGDVLNLAKANMAENAQDEADILDDGGGIWPLMSKIGDDTAVQGDMFVPAAQSANSYSPADGNRYSRELAGALDALAATERDNVVAHLEGGLENAC